MPKKKKRELNEKQKLFCELYATNREFFGNGTQAYIEAYDIDLTKKGAYASARVDASKLLTKSNILKQINELLDLGGLNDQRVDKELLFLIEQHSELGTKLGAIKEYNKLKERITDKLEISKKGFWDEIDEAEEKELKKELNEYKNEQQKQD